MPVPDETPANKRESKARQTLGLGLATFNAFAVSWTSYAAHITDEFCAIGVER